MKNLTESQKEIIFNLEQEFIKLNHIEPINSNGLIDFGKLKNLLSESRKEQEEILAQNKANAKMFKDYKEDTLSKVQESLKEVGINCSLCGKEDYQWIQIGTGISIKFVGYQINYITMKDKSTESKNTFVTDLRLLIAHGGEHKYKTIEGLCGSSHFEYALLNLLK